MSTDSVLKPLCPIVVIRSIKLKIIGVRHLIPRFCHPGYTKRPIWKLFAKTTSAN